MENRPRPICLVAGKSGGHILPCLTIAQKEYPGRQILFFSTNSQLDKRLLASEKLYRRVSLPLSFSGPSYKKTVGALLGGVYSLATSVYYLSFYRPACVITTGGLVAIPVCVAAWLMRIPVHLYELNAVPGRAIRLLKPLASSVSVCFASAQLWHTQARQIPYPVRFTGEHLPFSQNEKKTIVIIGGSQGSVTLNAFAAHAIKQLPNKSALRVIHQTGSYDTKNWSLFYEQCGVDSHVFAYDQSMEFHYQKADIIISRAGAGSLFEAKFFSKPCITVPLEGVADDHQLKNAQAIVREHGNLFCVVREQDGTKALAQKLEGLLHSTEK